MEIVEKAGSWNAVEPVGSMAAERLELLRSRLIARMTVWLGSRADAEDAAQEALLAAWVQNEEFRRVESPDAWLLRCARNSAIDAWRKETRRRGRESEWSLCSDRHEGGPSSSLSLETLQKALSALPEEASDLLFRVHFAGQSVAQIAVHEGRSRNAVHVRLCRARRALSRILGDAGPVEPGRPKRAWIALVQKKQPLQCKDVASAAS